MVGADGLKTLRQNGTGKLLLVNFWATWCAPCVGEFPDLEATYRMYRGRNVDFVTVSTNDPEEKPGVLEFLKKQHASHRNLQFATSDVYDLQAAFDPKMPAPVPFTLLLAPNGDVLYQELGAADIPKLRRAILANLPDDRDSAGRAGLLVSRMNVTADPDPTTEAHMTPSRPSIGSHESSCRVRPSHARRWSSASSSVRP